MHGWDAQVSDDEPVEFLIGMRWAQLWRLAANPWVPVAFAEMVVRAPREVRTRLGIRPAGPAVIQRWPSRSAVDAWARQRAEAHLGPWKRFRREVGRTSDWGVWHELAPVPDS